MDEITMLGIGVAQPVFQLHGVDAQGRAVLRRQLRRGQMLKCFQRLPPCLIGLEAGASAHCRARELATFGHEVRLMQPAFIKSHVKRSKCDKADAGANDEAVSRPSIRFVPVRSEDTQALLMTHIAPWVRFWRNARDILGRQQPRIVNASCRRHASGVRRVHLGEFGIVVPKGIHNVERLIMACEQANLPALARKALSLLADQLVDTQRRIEGLTADIRATAWHARPMRW